MTPQQTSTEVPLLVKGLTFEEMPVGQVFRTARRTITETDLVNFVTWGGFTEPLFWDASHAADGGYTGRLVPGGLTYCIAEGLVLQTNVLHGTGLAFLHMELDVLGPVYVGDTVYAVVETTGSRPSSKPGRGVVTSRITVRNQRDEHVLVYTPVRLIRGRDYEAPAS
ncbi:MaoC/PaaZ C-terminal domain-containing protein [Streptomyces sp. NBC_00882]|uniref:MaoC family dehydratase n=1 Tax=Streptomyces TaxID=1883 RepID=UPI00386A70B2|nr:MaoC/PaaZ C-terminal domain-containing protein [Streptomyces canus]WSZ36420.1 MaoC/PaaZ C-terminal domain-containing protein [Streptomyces sp. NBC_00882]WSZ63345.1 MaoC/PaaZ C-terminal domain-containing protein [Streptomyces canus]